MLLVTVLSLTIWVFLLLFWGNFWRADQRLDTVAIPDDALKQWPSVWVVIPARNEADVLPVSLRSHLTQTYPGNHHILLVDDQSTDGTGAVAKQMAVELNQSHKLTVLEGKPLPPGWTGKLWAMEQGYRWLKDATSSPPLPQGEGQGEGGASLCPSEPSAHGEPQRGGLRPLHRCRHRPR